MTTGESPRIGGVVLAAGASRRAGTVKALASIDGEAFVARAVRTLREGGCDEVVVVVGPPHAERVTAAVEGARVVENPAPAQGMLSSLQVALDDRWEAAVVSLVDHPRVRIETVRALIAAFGASDAELVRPVFEGRGGHPYVVARRVFAALRAGDPAIGPRPIYAACARLDVPVDDPAVREDLDTAEAIATVTGGRRSPA
ncbi:MAG: nucleotidyltransferase family protein [Sandaracinaceae bacterium]